ncbi:nucleotidyltransferase domain-containing protein [Brasilonema sp. UFV-L1]|uniref:nucleotidyltransferase domain-containing protein n=1 Tax=Brasilonema sp. UFV-L1 TaxID=2234130 RepID=UPI00145F39E7|nr:nucleotidyltransferase domain-containing protein [Brasilonema sp. UFV-L1]NMG05579.1 DNA polymerase subunit beta [Brasilonema sp. UFV-L1]
MNQPLPHFVSHIVDRLQSIQGVTAIVLGGSRARGNYTEKSDVDLGIYYQPENPPNLAGLNHLASELDDNHRANLITSIGEWGKWINGGGWLQVNRVPVDFLYRDISQVSRVIDACQAGRITIDYQPGHPHGFVSSIYMGEIAFCQPLHDPHGVMAMLKTKTIPYPAQLKQATIDKFAWEINFSLLVAAKAIARGDVAYAAGCCFRSVACMNQVLFALNEAYLLNEKGAVAIADTFSTCPQHYRARVESAFILLNVDARSIAEAIAILEGIAHDLSVISNL